MTTEQINALLVLGAFAAVSLAVLATNRVADWMWWWLHSGPDAFETLPAPGWLDEDAEVWHG